MTTSGETDFDPVRDIVIKGALRLVGAFPSTGLPRPEQIEDAQHVLNMMIKAWQIQGFLWVKEHVTLFLDARRSKYCLPLDGVTWGAQCYNTLALESNQIATDIDILFADTSGFTVGDSVGIMSDDWNLMWGKIISITDNVSIQLDTALTADAAEDNIIYTYQERHAIWRPTRIFFANRLSLDGHEVETTPLSRDDYNRLTNKLNDGPTVQYYFDPQKDVAELRVWSTNSDSRDRLVLDLDRPLEIMLDPSNTFDFPQEYIEILKYGLAVRLAPEYAVPLGEQGALNNTFNSLANNVLSYNVDNVSTFMGVQFNG